MGGRTVTYTLRADTDNFESGFKRAKTTAQDLFSSIGKDAERLVNGRKLAAAFKDIGKEMTAAFTLPIVGAFGAVLTASQGFDREMTKSMAIMGNVSTDTRKKLEDNARSVAKTFGVSHEEAAKSYYSLASAGLTAEQSIKALPLVAQFAKAGMMEMGSAADLLTGSQVALGLSFADPIRNATEMKRVSDVLVQANNFALGSTEEFAAALSNKAGAAMRQYGQSVEAGTAVLMAFAAQNVRGQTAGEQYAIAIRELARAALGNKDAFAQAKIAVFDSSGAMRNMADILADVEKRFSGMSTEGKVAELNLLGIKAKTQGAILPLIGMSDAIRGYETALKSASGATADVAAKQMKSFSEQMNLLKVAVTDVAISLGQTLLPIAQRVISFAKGDLLPAIEGTVEKFKALPESVQTGVIGFAALLAAAGPLIWTFGQIAMAVSTMVTAYKTLMATNVATWLTGITTAFTGLSGAAGIAVTAAYSFLQVGLAGAAGYALGSVLRDLIDNYFPKVGKWLDDLAVKAYEWWTGMTNAQRAAGKGVTIGPASFPEGGRSHDTGITNYGFDWSSPAGKAKLDALEAEAKTSAGATAVAFGAISTSAASAAGPVANLTGGVNNLTTSLTKAQVAAAKVAQAFKDRQPGGDNSVWGAGIDFSGFWGSGGGALPAEVGADLAKVKSRSKLDPHLSSSALQTNNRTLFNTATKDTATFSQSLQNLSNVFNLATNATGRLGTAARTLASVAGGGSGIAGGLGSLFGIGGQKKTDFGSGLTGILGKAGVWGGIASSALSIGSAIWGLFKKKPKEPPPPKEVDAATWKSFQGEQLGKGTSGLAAGVAGIQLTSTADLTSQATIAGLQFWSIFKTQGLTAAADATKGVIGKLVENLSQYGSEAATAVLAPIQQQIALAENDAFTVASEGAKGFADVLASQVNARMPMTIEQFGAFGQQAAAAFEQAKAGAIATGLSTEEATRAALRAVGPLVTTAVDAAATYGFAIDTNTQSLLDQAAASGVAFATDKTDRLVMSIDALTSALGGVPPAVGAIGAAINNLPKGVDIPVRVGGGVVPKDSGDGSGLDGPGFASGSGGLRNFGIETQARLHGREAVLTEPEFTSLTRAAQGGSSMSLTFGDITVNANNAQGGREAAMAFREQLEDMLVNNTAGMRDMLARRI